MALAFQVQPNFLLCSMTHLFFPSSLVLDRGGFAEIMIYFLDWSTLLIARTYY